MQVQTRRLIARQTGFACGSDDIVIIRHFLISLASFAIAIFLTTVLCLRADAMSKDMNVVAL